MKKRLPRLLITCLAVLCISLTVFGQQNVAGTLRSPSGEPLVGATVTVKGTNRSVVTDATGRFRIDAAPGSTLVVSSVGFQQREITVSGDEINEVLQVTDASLN